MNPKKLAELDGTRFAFAQNGALGVKLVHVTPPIQTLHHGIFGEAKWDPAAMPLSYASAPTLVNNFGVTDVPALIDVFSNARRATPVAKFASKFRSRRKPLPEHVGRELLNVYHELRSSDASIADSYVDALPYPPPQIDADRKMTYRRLIARGIGT
ncbi:hypothetical protein [Pseudoruegeria sp. HB172150]|uniref:hypothetical protein n=1 Tax=Pseudoruegeria sp. HB172150 TaxID=2721164 RepID=UPI001C12F218|nr:hypothetical protein [Pseudoruegeria sp. HB172150]